MKIRTLNFLFGNITINIFLNLRMVAFLYKMITTVTNYASFDEGIGS